MLDEIRQFLVTCSGEDNSIVKECGASIRNRFALLGFFVLLIFVGCMASAAFFTYSLFSGAKFLSIPLGLVWGAIVVNLYLLLLHTISPPIIPLSTKKKRKENKSPFLLTFMSASMISRIGFITLLATIVAQPISVFFLSPSIAPLIESHKIEERVQLYTLSNKHIIHKEIQEYSDFVRSQNLDDTHLTFVNTKMNDDEEFLRESISRIAKLDSVKKYPSKENIKRKTAIIFELENMLNRELDSDYNFIQNLDQVGTGIPAFEDFKIEIKKLVNQKIANYNHLTNLLNSSNFYVMKIQLLLEKKLTAWLITLSVCVIFLLPVYFKYKVRDLSARIFSSESHGPTISKLRDELISTTDFTWMKNTILSPTIIKIKTSDYYFRRMLIEHHIILEQYEEAKILYSKILSERILQYNRTCLRRLEPWLSILKKADSEKHIAISNELREEYADQVIKKFEYWLDCPFRTERRASIFTTANTEHALLEFLYNDSDDS